MSNPPHSNETVSLWSCLHDGSLESLTSDTLNRSIEIVIDVPYVWSFHSLPDTTRFRLLLEGVSVVEALHFAPWPGDQVIPKGGSRDDAEAMRKSFYDKGRRESMDWQDVAGRLVKTHEYEISDATLTTREQSLATLILDIAQHQQRDYPEIRVTAERIRFFLGSDRELSLPEFLDLGEAYWQAFEERRLGSS